MKKNAKRNKRLNYIANNLERFAQGIVDGLQLVVCDGAGAKRSQRK